MKSFAEVAGCELHNTGSNPSIDVDRSLCSVYPARIHHVPEGFPGCGGGGVKEPKLKTLSWRRC